MQDQARNDRAAARGAGQPAGILQGRQDIHNNANQENIPPNINNITVVGAGLDTFIPTIPEVRESDIKAKFPLQNITVIDGRPTYEKMLNCERELGKNALTCEVPFGGGNRGCLGSVYSAAKYLAEAGVVWDVPKSQGAYPIFEANATENDKKKAISAHIKLEKGIKTAKSCERLLINQLLSSVDDVYLLELKDGMREYQGRTLRELLAHLKKYGKMDNIVHERIMVEFREAPNMDLPIDKYFAKQRECQVQLADSDDPISDAAMVKQLAKHLGKVPGIGRRVIKFERRDAHERTWAIAKTYFREVIDDLDAENQAYGMEPGLQANATVAASHQKAEAEQKARDDIADQMSGSFQALAGAAVAKAETLDHNAAAIASLTKSVAELSATNKRLVAQLAEALTNTVRGKNRPPPGFPAPSTAPSAQTTHILNTAGVACPAKLQPSGRYHFVTGQHCKTCGKQGIRHVPSDCLELPANAGRKAILASMDARNKSATE